MKSIAREKISNDIQMLQNELEILLNADHPNIINFHEIYMDENFFHFVTNVWEGGELY